jgi:hypothetical protein
MELSGHPNILAALLPGKEYSVPIALEAEWASDSVWIFWKREKSLAPARNQIHSCWKVTENVPCVHV